MSVAASLRAARFFTHAHHQPAYVGWVHVWQLWGVHGLMHRSVNETQTWSARGKQSEGRWWAVGIADDHLAVLLSEVYTGPGAVEFRDETYLGGMHKIRLCSSMFVVACHVTTHWMCDGGAGRSVHEQLLARRQHLVGKLSDTTIKNYQVGLR